MNPRDLDCLVAEHVFGLRVVARDWPCGYEPECGIYEADLSLEPDPELGRASWYTERGPVYAACEDGWPPRDDGQGRLVAIVRPVPFYSTDIADAWGVVEAMIARRYEINLGVSLDSRACCTISKERMAKVRFAPGVPEAICRAALAALGVEAQP